MENKEVSNQDLLESISGRFNMVFEELQKNGVRFDTVYKHLATLIQGQKELGEESIADRETLEEISETLQAVAKAVDADAMTLIRHDRRITKLEKLAR